MNIHSRRLSGFLALFFKRSSVEVPSDAGMRAFQSLRRQAKANGLQDMSLDEINAEITKSRAKKGK